MRASSTRRKITFLKYGAAAVVVGVIGLVMFLILPTLRERNFSRHFDDMQRIEKPDFYRIYHEADDPLGREVESVVGDFLAYLSADWGDASRMNLREAGGVGFPIVVLLFKNERRLQAYHGARYREQNIRYNAGMYEPVAGTIALISDRQRGSSELRRGLYHEFTHLVLDRLVRGEDHAWSRWLNEGLATYLEASHAEGAGFRLGDVSERHLRYLHNHRNWRLAEVFEFTQESFTGKENIRAYALSGVLVSFLLEGEVGAWEERFWRYYEHERAPGRASRLDFERIMKISLDELDARVRRFVADRLLQD